MDASQIALATIGVVLIAMPAFAKFPAPEKHPGSCLAVYNQSKSTYEVRVIKPKGYSGIVWKITGPAGGENPLGVALTTSRGPVVSPDGDWDVSMDPDPGKPGWQYIQVKAQSCTGTWYVSVGVPKT